MVITHPIAEQLDAGREQLDPHFGEGVIGGEVNAGHGRDSFESRRSQMPSRDSLRRIFLMLGAAATVAAALLHGLVNVPHLREDLLELGIRPSLVLAVSLVLYFSVVAMFGFA